MKVDHHWLRYVHSLANNNYKNNNNNEEPRTTNNAKGGIARCIQPMADEKHRQKWRNYQNIERRRLSELQDRYTRGKTNVIEYADVGLYLLHYDIGG